MPARLLILVSALLILACSRTDYTQPVARTPFLNANSEWADSVLLTLSLEEKIGQLLFLQADEPAVEQRNILLEQIRNGQISGIELSGVTLSDYANFIDTAQALASIPLLTATSQCVSPNNIFTDQQPYPLPVTVAALQNDTVYRELREEYLLRARALQLDLVFAPQLDGAERGDSSFNFQIEAQNPVVARRKAQRMLTGLQTEGILSVATHFNDLVYLENDTLGIVDKQLQKYSQLVNGGLSGIVIDEQLVKDSAHLIRPEGYIKQYLAEKVKFDGLIFAEARDTETVAELFYAGTDILLIEGEPALYADFLKGMVAEGHITQKSLNSRVYKILMAKSWRKDPAAPARIEAAQIAEVFESSGEQNYLKNLYTSSIVLARNQDRLLPLNPGKSSPDLVQIGTERYRDFEKSIKFYSNFRASYTKPESGKALNALPKKSAKKPLILCLNSYDLSANRDTVFIQSVNRRSQQAPVILINYGNPLHLKDFDPAVVIIQSFENNKIIRQHIAQLIYGGTTASGKLPVAVADHLPYGAGSSGKKNRLAYASPQSVGIDPVKLVGIDALMKSAIGKKVTPGGQVMVIKDGKVIYDKTFGHHTYSKKRAVKSTDLYDIASLTKITATTLAAMKAYESNKFSLKSTLKNYLPLEDNKKMGRLTLKKLLTHSSGLQSNMPISRYVFLKDTLDPDCNIYFCKTPESGYNTQIADNFYFNTRWRDTLWNTVLEIVPKRRKKRYHYSDVNFNLLQFVIEKQTGQTMEKYLKRNFYKPLDLRYLTYLPTKKFDKKQIVPTATDKRWRNQQVHGFVHDESAALLGGIAGNAGQFSNAHDLGVLFQMLLNEGTYGGQRFLKPETIRLFTSVQYGTHRGLGFDTRAKHRPPSCGAKASKKTYGHTGFTGTCVWVDPKEELIFIFLSNRVFPDAGNKKLFKTKLRSRIHDVVYGALGTYKEKKKSKTAHQCSAGLISSPSTIAPSLSTHQANRSYTVSSGK